MMIIEFLFTLTSIAEQTDGDLDIQIHPLDPHNVAMPETFLIARRLTRGRDEMAISGDFGKV
jgi:hypothetical protein